MIKAIERKRRRATAAFALALGLLGPLAARAEADAVAARLLGEIQATHPGTRFTEIARTDVPGLYEVWMSGTVAYVSTANPRIFLFGRLFDTKDMHDLTAPKLAQRADGDVGLAAESQETDAGIDIDRLPLSDAITFRRGNGQRQIVVFSDPSCVYCKQLEVELATLNDVAIHIFPVPFQGEVRPIAIWCATDRARAWHQWMLNGDSSAVQGHRSCDHPITRNLALARSLRVQGTPTLFWADGSRTDGYIDRGVLQARLESAERSTWKLGKPTAAAAAPAVPERRP